MCYLVILKSPVEYPDEIINNTGFPLEFIPYLIRGGNDTFFQSVPSLLIIPAKLVLDSDRGAGIQELIDNLSIVDKQNVLFVTG
jgi:hypothetical protein